MIEFWVIVTGVLVGITCSIAGVFLILRKMSMIADAISHTVLFRFRQIWIGLSQDYWWYYVI